MRLSDRRMRRVLALMEELEDGLKGRSPGIMDVDVAARSRSAGDPLAVWEVRGALCELERAGRVTMNSEDCSWRTTDSSPSPSPSRNLPGRARA